MANGMDMMFKSMGIDIEGIKQVLNPETVKRFVEGFESLSTRVDDVREQQTSQAQAVLFLRDGLASIDERLTRIEIKLETLPTAEAMLLLKDGEKTAHDAVNKFVHDYNNAPIDVTGTFGGEVGALERMLPDGRGSEDDRNRHN